MEQPICDCGALAVTNDGLLCRKCLSLAMKEISGREPRTLYRKGTEEIGRPMCGSKAIGGSAELNNDGDD